MVKILYLYFRLFRFKMKVDSNKVDSNKVEKITKRHKIELSYEIKRKIVNYKFVQSTLDNYIKFVQSTLDNYIKQ